MYVGHRDLDHILVLNISKLTIPIGGLHEMNCIGVSSNTYASRLKKKIQSTNQG